MVPLVSVAVPPLVTDDDGDHVMSALGTVKMIVLPEVRNARLSAVPVASLDESAVAVNVIDPDDGEPKLRLVRMASVVLLLLRTTMVPPDPTEVDRAVS